MSYTLANRTAGGVETLVEATGDGRLFLRHQQDAEQILDANKASENGGRSHWGADADMWRVASIPHIVILKWKNDHGIDFFNADHWPKVVALLNSSEYAWLRTGGGRL
jgi:hypothetical protein